MTFKEKYGPWVVIAGSAEGLGEAWSRVLAKRKLNLVMIDHQEEKLHQLSKELEETQGISTLCLTLDLSENNAADLILKEIETLNCRLLVYNAAFSIVKPFLAIDYEDLDNFVDINIRTQLKLVHAFSKKLTEKGTGGGIIMMSSLAGLLGMQLVAPYAATKAFAWNLAEALHHELKDHDIDVMACIAGATSTPAYLETNPYYGSIKPQVMPPDKVAEAALKKLGKKTLFIAGRSNRINYFILTSLLPRKLASRIANNTMWNMYKNNFQ